MRNNLLGKAMKELESWNNLWYGKKSTKNKKKKSGKK